MRWAALAVGAIVLGGGWWLAPWWRAVARGLAWRGLSGGPPIRVEIAGEALVIWDRRRPRAITVSSIARARDARSVGPNATGLVASALTLFDGRGRKLAKVPASARGYRELCGALMARAIPIDVVEVSAPR